MEPGDVKGITLKMEDGTVKEVNKGIVVQIHVDKTRIDLLHCAPLDVLLAGIAIMEAIRQMGMQEEFEKLSAYYESDAYNLEEE